MSTRHLCISYAFGDVVNVRLADLGDKQSEQCGGGSILGDTKRGELHIVVNVLYLTGASTRS